MKGQDHFQPIVLACLRAGIFAKELWSQNFYVIPTIMTPIRISLSDINAQGPAILEGLHETLYSLSQLGEKQFFVWECCE